MAERRVPRIRFKGFEEDWEQRELGKFAAETRGGGTPTTSNRTYWNGDIPWIQSSDLKEDELFEVKPRKYVSNIGLSRSATQLVEANSIAVVTRVGVGKLALMPNSYTTSQDFVSLSRLQVAPYFAVYSIYHMLQEELQVVQGTSIKGMTKEDLLSKSLLIPVDIGEQTRLGCLFYKIDSLLSLHQRKLEKLKILKKAMLEKMFPKNGAKVPEIRFSGFTDDWEQRELGKFAAETRGGGTPTTSNRTYWNGDIPWIQSSDLKEDELFEVKPRKYVSNIGLSRSATQLVEANSIAVVTRVGVGKLALMPNSYTTSQDFVSLSRLQVAPYFAVYSIYHMLQEELQVVQGTSIKGMTKEDLLSKSLLIPVDIGEQTRLGCLFYKIDSLLSLHQRKLEKLRQIKKSMLERMFV